MPESPSRHLRRLVVGLIALVALGGIGASVADDVAWGREDATLAPVGSLVADDDLDPRILDLALTGASWDKAVAQLDEALFAREDADRRASSAAAAIVAIRAERAEVQRVLLDLQGEAAGLDDRISDHEAALRERALELFVSYGEATDLDALRSPESATSGARVQQLADEVDATQIGVLRSLHERRESIEEELAGLVRRVGTLNLDESTQLALLSEATSARADVAVALDDAIARVREARRQSDVEGLPMSVVALDAYLRAEVRLSEEMPACALDWWMIAGIGRVESHHGELGGRRLRPDGTVSTPIVGVALDGGPGVRAVLDTDGGSFDEDAVWDRAVGPMQFIPETWSIRGGDGDGDGVRDPQNIYDAAYTTGRFLCRLGGDLHADGALDAAYFGYNTSDEYVAAVSGYAKRYRDFVLPPRPTSPTDAPAD